MKALVLLVVGVLVCSLTGAQTVSRCQLIDKLKAAINSLPKATHAELAEDDFLVARIVCHVVHGSNFSTSTATELIQKDRGHDHHRHDRSAHQESSRDENHINMTLSEENNHGNTSKDPESAEHHRHRRDAPNQHGNKEGDHNVTHDVQNDHGNSSIDPESAEHHRHRRDAPKQHDKKEGDHNVTHDVQNDHGNSSIHSESAEHHRHRRDAPKQHDKKEGDHNVTLEVQNDHGNSSIDPESAEHHRHRRDAPKQHDNKEGDYNVTHDVQNDHGNSSIKNRFAEHRRRRAAHHQNYEMGQHQNVTYYGIFQLPECTCRNSMNTSKNICGIDCSRLTDGNINDDISCLLTILADHDEHHSQEKCKDGLYPLNSPELEMCEGVIAADYIGGCPAAP